MRAINGIFCLSRHKFLLQTTTTVKKTIKWTQGWNVDGFLFLHSKKDLLTIINPCAFLPSIIYHSSFLRPSVWLGDWGRAAGRGTLRVNHTCHWQWQFCGSPKWVVWTEWGVRGEGGNEEAETWSRRCLNQNSYRNSQVRGQFLDIMSSIVNFLVLKCGTEKK